jgi:hypothetical protein
VFEFVLHECSLHIIIILRVRKLAEECLPTFPVRDLSKCPETTPIPTRLCVFHLG